ncbi:MAG: VOC family protein [Myxococcaceae bacterium]|nr:VOC family protein [Myxococcaceae bacterium]
MPNGFVHIELNTDDLAGSRKFYGKLFKWKLSPMPGMATYIGVDAGKGATGGGMQTKPMPEAPTSWLPYVEVDDVKKTIARARKLGATIVLEYQPIGEMGEIGIFMDPSGAALGVWAAAKKPKKKKSRR